MADILVKCKKCGRETKVSEYAVPGAVVCPGCGAPLEFTAPSTSAALRLKLRADGSRNGGAAPGANPKASRASTANSAMHTAEKVDILRDVHKPRKKVHRPLAIWNWVAFAALGGLLVGAEYYVTVMQPTFQSYYLMGRWGVWGFITLLVLIVAFEDGAAQGLLCLFVPLYIVYYALVRLEYYWLRGLFLAVLLGIGMELYYMPDQSALVLLQRRTNAFITGVSKQIERAGASPDIPAPPPKIPRMQRWKMQNPPQR